MANGISGLSDSEFSDVVQNMVTVMTANPAAYFTTGPQVTALSLELGGFDAALADHISAQAAAKNKTELKLASRAAVEELVRSFRNIAKASGTTAADMDALGLPGSSGLAPSNATRPDAMVDTSDRFRHTLSWTDEATPDNKRKPRGQLGCEIWVKVGDPPPSDEKDLIFLTLDAFTPYLAEYTAADVGKMAHYMLRWRARDGSVSAWSETVSATITG